jgi:hypothetical protein
MNQNLRTTDSVTFANITGPLTGTATNANHLNTTRDTPSNSLQYWQASGLGITEAPTGDWHNTIRMGHGSPLTYYSNTLAVRMTGTGPGDIYTQTIANGVRQGWKKHWNDGNDGAGSGLDADLWDGYQFSDYLNQAVRTTDIVRFSQIGLGGVTPDTRLSANGDIHVSGYIYQGGTAGSVGSWGSRTIVSSGDYFVDARSFRFDNDGYGSTWSFLINSSGNVIASVDMRAPIFYDQDNTAYYGNFNGISSMYGLAIRGDNSSTDSGNQIFFWGSGDTTTSAIGFKANGGEFPNPTGFGDGYNTYLTMDSDGRG